MNLVTIGSDNGLSAVRRQAITWTNADLLSDLEKSFNEIPIKIHFSFTKMHLKMPFAKRQSLWYGGDELIRDEMFHLESGDLELPML